MSSVGLAITSGPTVIVLTVGAVVEARDAVVHDTHARVMADLDRRQVQIRVLLRMRRESPGNRQGRQ